MTSTRQLLRIIRQAVLPQVVQTPVRPVAMAKALNQPAVLPARTILATALNSPRNPVIKVMVIKVIKDFQRKLKGNE